MSFSIDRIYYINQDARVDKHWIQLFVLYLFGVPYDRVCRFPCRIQNYELPSTPEIAEMMVKDGWDEWGIYADGTKTARPTWLASTWSKLSLIRDALNDNVNFVMLSDICYLLGFDRHQDLNNFGSPIDFRGLQQACGKLPNLKVLNLNQPSPIWDLVKTQEQKIERTNHPNIFTPMFTGKFCALVFTPQGAQEVLTFWRTAPRLNSDNIFLKMFKTCDNYDGYYFFSPSIVRLTPRRSDFPHNLMDKVYNEDTQYFDQILPDQTKTE